MRLTKIKLAGFKSFVDPTTFHLPSNLVGIVGPNGCGKSNLIDAVRWVMGESSVRTLRGDSMADVIFNGSSTRKPIGQAFVELSFDNNEGKLGGPWARYNEIAVKRLVSRDGQSIYFLNGSRCRRRDITGIFMGTGLGPRSYAIIEQGMIARIVDARPEELRVFFEEAAGISKYKDRRRETEIRIRHTRENLERLTDLREELDRQLKHLQRQAQSAERYQQYKAQQRQLRSQLLALRWRGLDAEVTALESLLREQETALEAVMAEQRSLEARLVASREQRAELDEGVSQVQQRYYAVGAEITRLELSLEHRRELRQRQNEELRQTEQNLVRVVEQINTDQTQLDELEKALAASEPQLASAQAAEAAAKVRLTEAETAMADYQLDWETFSQRASVTQRSAEVEGARSEHLQRQLWQQQRQLQRLDSEQQGLDSAGLEAQLEALQLREQEAEAVLELHQQELERTETEITERREWQRQRTLEVNQLRERVQADRGKLASLETLQEAALGQHEETLVDWLKAQQLDQAPRLAEQLDVEAGWERAAETVLGIHLEAICVEGLDRLAATLQTLERGSLTLVEMATKGGDDAAEENNTLWRKMCSPWPLKSLLAGVGVAADLSEALARRAQLTDCESLITPDGAWLGRNWVRIARGSDDKTGILVRERELQSLNAALQRDTALLQEQGAELEQIQWQLQDLEQQRTSLQAMVNQDHREHAHLQAQVHGLYDQLAQAMTRRGAIAEEIEELRCRQQQDDEEWRRIQLRREEALAALEQLAEERQTLTVRRQALESNLEAQRAQAEATRQAMQKQALAIEALRSNKAATEQALVRLKNQRSQLDERHKQLVAELAMGDDREADERLEELLENRIEIEEELLEARRLLEAQEADLRALEQARTQCERQGEKVRQTLETQRLSHGEAGVRRQTLRDRLGELGMDPASVLAELTADLDETDLQGQLEQLENRLQRLGPINLAAIDEFAQLSERKHYLDTQHNDLVEALSTLENAIRKIDRETRSRFKETFERVNEGLQALFPRLFGGGHAHLELTGEDALDAGVAIMARPPGKRIGNIHLLSGGEKALTAVALVFAIFQLNPAPFCMLDEVDAPLDEANVGRFGELVQEMSEWVQFIFITHNKGTMEIAHHLSGVTMHEPGVSRLVSVDVAEAVRLAAE